MNPYQIYQAGMDGMREGRERGTQNRLGRLYSEAMTATPEQRQGLLGQMAQSSPQAALQTQGMFRDMDQNKMADLARDAGLFVSAAQTGDPATIEQMYAPLAEKARAVTGAPIPSKYDPRFLPMLQKLAGGSAGEGYTLSPGAKRFDASGNMVAEAPFAPDRPQNAVFQTDANGVGYWLSPGQAPQRADMPGQPQQGVSPNTAGGMPAPTTGAGASIMQGAMLDASPKGVQGLITNLAGQFGGQVSSLERTPAHNAKVGGVANSQHTRGTAGDVVFTDPQAKARYMDAARRAGLEVIDEGDHVHAELPPGGGGAQVAQAGGGINFGKPTAQAAPAGYRFNAAGNLEHIPGGPADPATKAGGEKPTATQLKLANTAKAKLIDINAIEAQLARVEESFSPLKGSYSAGPYIGGLIPSEDGKRFDGAVSLLQGMVRKLTRTPGEGAMSDYETKLSQLANPSRSQYESVTGDQIEQLRALIQTTRQGYEALLQDAGGNSANLSGRTATPAAGADRAPSNDINALLDMYR